MEQNIILIVLSALVALIGRYLWDRYMSQSSRVTQKEFLAKMEELDKRLEDGTHTFKKINSCFAAMCLVMLRLCEKAEIDCDDIRKQMIESGLDL